MAVLPEADRQVAARAWVRKAFVELDVVADLAHDSVKAAVDNTDDWIDGNQASFNAALPEPFKSTATLQQKTLLFMYVAMKRAGLI